MVLRSMQATKTLIYRHFSMAHREAKLVNYVQKWIDFPQVFRGGISNDALNKSAILVNGWAAYYG